MTPTRAIAVVALLALGHVAGPCAAAAQPAPRTYRIGYLSHLSAATDAPNREAFVQGLAALGYVEGRNVAIEARYGEGRFERLPALATELVGLRVDVIVTALTPAVRAAQQATRTIPIVMAFSGDPVGEAMVTSLARPGGNITGLSATVAEMAAKRVEYLKAIVPRLTRVTHLNQQGTARVVVAETEAAGRALSLQVSTVFVRDAGEVDRALTAMRDGQGGGMIVNLTLREHWRQIVDLALRYRLPTAGGAREFVEMGGLMAYGPNYVAFFRRAATYVDRILSGARPADLPVEQPTTYTLIVNLKTAQALGLPIPPELLARVDEVIR